MKKLLLTLATFGLTLSVFGQGAVIIDNNNANGYLDINGAGNHYTGSFALELWYKNGTTPDSTINSLNGTGLGYSLLAADGFTLATHINRGFAVGGVFAGLGEVDIPGVDRSVNGGNAVLGLAIWATPVFGVITFVNPTSDYTIPPPNTPVAPLLEGMDTDLIMAWPEPSTAALAGLGAAVLLVFRRRKQWTN